MGEYPRFYMSPFTKYFCQEAGQTNRLTSLTAHAVAKEVPGIISCNPRQERGNHTTLVKAEEQN